MLPDFKSYKSIKTKSYIKEKSLYFFFNGISKESSNWVSIEQNFKTTNFNYYKVFNQTSRTILSNSIYKNTKWIINSITFFIYTSTKNLFKQILVMNFESLLFNMLSVKINNKIYQSSQLKKNYSLNYKNNKKLIFQFKVTNLRQL